MDVLQYLMTKDLQDTLGPEWNPAGTQKWYKEMLDFELESYRHRRTEDLEKLKDTLENAVRERHWPGLEYGTLEPLDVINWRPVETSWLAGGTHGSYPDNRLNLKLATQQRSGRDLNWDPFLDAYENDNTSAWDQ